MTTILEIDNLYVKVDKTSILRGVNLKVKTGEIHIIMGTNGAGKSTLAATIMGYPKYKISKGEIKFLNQDLLKMKIDERARAGIFLGHQSPCEIDGVSNFQFLKNAINLKRNKNNQLSSSEFNKIYEEKVNLLQIMNNNLNNSVNVGYSGGEKKKNEILQMLLLEPKLVILDEIDSGLDMDAIKLVGQNIIDYFNNHKTKTSLLIITHYPRIIEYIKPDYVHILHNGKIIKTGNDDLIYKLEENGYDWIIKSSENNED